MLKSNKGYNLAQNANKKLPTVFTKIMAVILLATTFAVAPVALSSCSQDAAVHESIPSVSEKEMNAFVEEYFKFPPIGNLSNPTSIAYSISASSGRVYAINIVSTGLEPDGTVPVYLTKLEFPHGLSEKDIERNKGAYSSSFSNTTITTAENGEPIDIDEIYLSNLGEDYVVAKEYEGLVEDGIEA